MAPGSMGFPGCGSSRGSQDGRASMADGLRDESDEEKDARCVKLPKLGSDAAAAAAEEFEEEQRKEQMMALLGNTAALAITTTTRRTPTVITTPRKNTPGRACRRSLNGWCYTAVQATGTVPSQW